MNLKKLREALTRCETESGTERMKVGIVVRDPKTGEVKHLGITDAEVATYRDPGEVNHVVWLITGEY